MTKDEALKLALEALEDYKYAEARTIIRQALEQPAHDQFKPDYNTEAVLVEEMQRMAKRIEELETAQEPVAYQCKGIPRKGCNYLTACDCVCNKCGEIHHHHQMVANFTFPPQRPWVGLTKKDKWEIVQVTERDDRSDVMELTEAKLKDKNTP